MGAEDQTMRIWAEEDWDAEARSAADYAYANGVRKVTMVVGLLQVEADGEHCSVNGCINKDTGELFVRADSPRESVSEIIEHEVGHLKTNAAKVRAFMEAVKRGDKEASWSKIYETYEQRYTDVTDDYTGMSPEAKELYIWEEIQCDAAAFTNKFGARASVYNAEATQTLESNLTSEETVGPGYRFEGGRYSNRETSAATDRTNGPGENAVLDSVPANSYDGKDLSSDQSVYTYEFLTEQEPMHEVAMPEISEVLDKSGEIDNHLVIQNGLRNAEKVGTIIDGKAYVQNRYTNKDLRVDAESVRHGLNGDLRRHMTNARIGSVIGDVVQNAIPLNALHNTGKDVTGTYAMGCYVTDSLGREYVAIITVEERTNDVLGLQIEDAVHAVSGRQKKAGGRTQSPQGVYPSSTADISIADFLRIVNSTHQSLLSNDVLLKFNASKNPNGYYTTRAKFSMEGHERGVDWAGNRDGTNGVDDSTEEYRPSGERAGERLNRGLADAVSAVRRPGGNPQEAASDVYSSAEFIADLNEISGRRTIRKNELTEERIQRLEKLYPDRIITDKAFWNNLVSGYGEQQLHNAGFTFEEKKRKPRKAKEADQQAEEPLGPPRPESGTTALQELGVTIRGSVGDFSMVKQMIANDKSAKSVLREVRRAEQRLGRNVERTLFAKEKNFAAGIAAGLYAPSDIPSTMDTERVLELAEYYAAEQATRNEMIRQRRAQIRRELDHQMGELFQDAEDGKPSSMIVLNERTPERNMRHIFGDELGERINREIFYPVQANEAERLRFINRMHDEVRVFTDKAGKKSKLTKAERAITQMLIESKGMEELAASAEISEAVKNAAAEIAAGGKQDKVFKKWNLDSKARETAAKLAAWQTADKAMKSGKIDDVRVQNAVETYTKLYNQLYEGINDFLVAHGYEPIGFIRNYAPHMQSEETQNLLVKAFQHLGMNAGVTELPASIAGLTADFKPSKRWNPRFLQRTGEITKYDVAEGFEEYIEYISDIFYHMDDTMRVRQAANYFRETFAPEEIKGEIERVKALLSASPEEKLELLRDAKEVGTDTVLSGEDLEEAFDKYLQTLYERIDKTTKHSNLTMWLDNYANLLAGKQSMADRGQEYSLGRKAANTANRLVRMFAQSKVAGNLSSVFNQGAQLPMIYSELGARWTAAAMKDIVSGKLRRAAWWQQSDFLTGKHGVEYLVTTPGEMVMTAMFKPAELMDGMVSTLAVRGKYLQEIRHGKTHEEAMQAADRFGTEIMGSRMKGSRPTAYSGKGIVSQMVHIFQVEAVNSWEHLTQDLPRDIREISRTKGKGKAALALAGVITKMLLAAFVLNRWDDELYGGTPAAFDLLGISANFIASGEGLTTNEWLRTVIDNGLEQMTGKRLFDTDADEPGDEDFNWEAALSDTGYNISNDVPFIRNIAGLMGWGDQSLPMPDIINKGKNVADAISGHGVFSPETGEAVLKAGTELVPGGNQINKAIQGLVAVLRGGDFTGYGDNEKLKYPLNEDALTALRAILFGKYATKESDAYYASGDRYLSEKQTVLWHVLTRSGLKRQDAYKAIQDFRDIEAEHKGEKGYVITKMKRDFIAALPWSDQQKVEMYFTMIADSDAERERVITAQTAGIPFNDYLTLKNQFADYDNDDSLEGFQKTSGKRSAIAGMEWKDEQKIDMYFALMSNADTDAEHERVDASQSCKVSFNDYLALKNRFAEIENDQEVEGYRESVEKRNAIAETNWTDAQKAKMYFAMTGAEEKEQGRVETFLDNGISFNDYVALKNQFAEIEHDDKMAGWQKSAANRNAIAAMRWKDDQKAAAFGVMISDEKEDDIREFRKSGLDFNAYVKVYNEYARIDNQNQGTAGQKATEFSQWLNKQHMSTKQTSTAKDVFKYYSHIPATAGKYDAFIDAGIRDKDATKISSAISVLKPENGEEEVSSLQKYQAVVRTVVDEETQMRAFGELMQEAEYAKLTAAHSLGLAPKHYVEFKAILPDYDEDGNGNYTQKEVASALRSMPGLTDKQRAILWQMANKTWKSKSNPFDTGVGADMYDALHD